MSDITDKAIRVIAGCRDSVVCEGGTSCPLFNACFERQDAADVAIGIATTLIAERTQHAAEVERLAKWSADMSEQVDTLKARIEAALAMLDEPPSWGTLGPGGAIAAILRGERP